ncbi:drug resistance transporter, EmrB/QacA subfamily [Actinacidiphila yanglinensis]|uniref:Drug resistance transporter, EmrB/QacA subfamily n=1 Tax=Actinacidiphila yanglinensis TaxID=310779 RepID=A0A1H6A2X1_9ACTN|nr:MFS transporter [Actinacidiphila yanglinensis]SEG42574.1 drug resistance transporter, EmrB/QacA subfamily [Actinacidiphila yanglinensis]
MSLKPRTAPPWALLVACCTAQFMVILDVTIVNVALPQMRDALGLSTNGLQWVVNAYTLTFAGFLMLGGRAADLWGRRRTFLAGLALFTACSLMGGLAQSGAWLVTARAAQGVGGAVLAPATLSLLTSRYTDPHERRRALGAWSVTSASGAAVGVLAGGVLTDLLDWRWVLFVNVPIGAAVAALMLLTPADARRKGAGPRLDVVGALTVTSGLAVLVYGIVGTNGHPWGSARTLATLGAGVVLLAVFAVTETRFATNPLVPFSVFRRRSLSVANAVTVTIGAANFGAYYFLSLYLQQVERNSPLRAGLDFLPIGLSAFAGALLGTRLVTRIGVRNQLVLGPGVAAAGLLWMATTLAPGQSYPAHLLVPLILFGGGIGLSFTPMAMGATHGVPPDQAGLASGLVNATRQVGGAVGLAVMATAATSLTTRHVRADGLPRALTDGYALAFLIAGLGLAAGMLLALALPSATGRPQETGATGGSTSPASASSAADAPAPLGSSRD